MGLNNHFSPIVYLCMCITLTGIYCQLARRNKYCQYLLTGFCVHTLAILICFLCRRVCSGCPLMGPKPVSEPLFGYPKYKIFSNYQPQKMWMGCKRNIFTGILASQDSNSESKRWLSFWKWSLHHSNIIENIPGYGYPCIARACTPRDLTYVSYLPISLDYQKGLK